MYREGVRCIRVVCMGERCEVCAGVCARGEL